MTVVKRLAGLFLLGVGVIFFPLVPGGLAAPLTLHQQLEPLTFRNHRLSVPQGSSLLVARILQGSGDLDVFLKKGSPVSGGSLSELMANADVYATGDGWQEIVALNRGSIPALTGGDWYLAVLNLGEQASSYTVSVFLDPQPANMVKNYFPYVIEYGTWHTDISLLNCSDTETVSGDLRAYDVSGFELDGGRTVSLAPNARLNLRVADSFPAPGSIYYMTFTTTAATVKGYASIYVDGVYRVALPLVSVLPAADLHIPHIASDAEWETEISLLNASGGEKTVIFEFNDGRSVSRTLAAGAYDTFTISRLFDGTPQPAIQSATLRNGAGILGVLLFSNNQQKMMDGLLLDDASTEKIFFPHTATTDVWATGIVVYNPESAACNLAITPFDAAGNRLGGPSSHSLSGRQKYIGVVANLGFPEATAWVQVEAEHPVSGFELFMNFSLAQMGGYSGVNLSGRAGLFPRVGAPDTAGIAFINQDTSPAEVLLTAYDQHGGQVATQVLSLGVGEKKVGITSQLFAESTAAATHVRYTANRDVVGFQLCFSPDGSMLDGLGALQLPEAAEIAGAGIIELAARALESGDKAGFLAMVSPEVRSMIEAGGDFNLVGEGEEAARGLAASLRRGQISGSTAQYVSYETLVDEDVFNFFVYFDGDAAQWLLGGL